MLASIEFFIFLLIAGGTALFNWLKQRSEREAELKQTHLPPPPARQRESTINRGSPPPLSEPPKRTRSWEDELRDMLEGTTPTTRTPEPPPVVIPERKVPPLPQKSAPPPVRTPPFERIYKAHCNHCGGHIEFPASDMEGLVACPHCNRATVLRPFMDTPVEVLSHQKSLSALASPDRKHDTLAEFRERIASHMHGTSPRPVALDSLRTKAHKQEQAELAEVRGFFRNARTVRPAIIASLILGKPKALED